MTTAKDQRWSTDHLPEVAFTFEKLRFSPRSEDWVIRDAANEFVISWRDVANLITPTLLASFQLVLLWFLENRSASRVRNIFGTMKAALGVVCANRAPPIAQIDQLVLTTLRQTYRGSREWRLGTLSSFFKRWHAQGHPGITDDAIDWFEATRIKGNQKGVAVATQDPHSGPFTQNEALAIQLAVTDALATNRITLQDHVLTTLVSALGSRCVQMAALKCGDLRALNSDEGFILDVPRSKQRLKNARAELRPRKLIPALGELLATQIARVQEEYAAQTLPAVAPEELPIFPNWHAVNPPGLAFHSTGTELGKRLSTALRAIDAKSERTGEKIHITARRFRYTVGTRAAEEGHGELVIAELLDHSDIQQVAVYVMATQKIIQLIDKAVAHQLAPLAQAFAGELIVDETHASRGSDPTSRIRDPGSSETLGNCGRSGYCSECAPIACYTCRRFQPWVDAPHEMLLDALLMKRERLYRITGDLRIASVSDRTILAVADVVRRCSEYRQRSSQ